MGASNHMPGMASPVNWADSLLNAALRHLGARRTGKHDEIRIRRVELPRHIGDRLPELQAA